MRTLILAAMIAMTGCATQSETPAVVGVAPQPALALAQPAESAAVAGEPGRFKPPKGYKKRVENGNTIYCTKIVVLGSRFPKEDCRTMAELRDLEANKDAARAEMDQQRRVCTSAAGCANP